jgi:formylglycine-generating enzyme required for sulfatase activity
MLRWQDRLTTTLCCGVALVACSTAENSTPEPRPPAQGGTGSSARTTTGGAGAAPTSSSPAGSGGASAPSNLASGADIDELPDAGQLATTFPEGPSCTGGDPEACHGESCCKRAAVRTGEIMLLTPSSGVSLSAFTLDKFEVTVGRFRRFVDDYNQWRQSNPLLGAGAHPYTEGSGWNTDPAWEVALAGSAAVLRVGLNCSATQQTWTDEPGDNELKPINCINWYEAFAFCVWDDGRLPSEAEWQYAAAGGAQGRQYAWGNTPLLPSFAVYQCLGAGTATCSIDDILPVGSRPDGNGRFGHSDLVGSMYEWTLDWYAAYPEAPRDDYAKTDVGTGRVLRGGAWNSTAAQALRSTDRASRPTPGTRSSSSGIRCARDSATDSSVR